MRYALVGGVGIPVNLGALALFLSLTGERLYPLAFLCAFEVSTTVNFVLNQTFTYGDQKHLLHGWDWVRRAVRAQVTSGSALVISAAIAFAIHYGLHVSPLLSNFCGIVGAFFYNYAVSNRLVYRAVTPTPPIKPAGSEG